jgi:general secretion pathway protein I
MFQSSPNPHRRAGDLDLEVGSSWIAGFTLIEILVAFVIAVLALSTLYRMASTGLGAESAAAHYSHALLIAESALEAVGSETPLTPGTSTPRIDDAYDEELVINPRPDLLPREYAASGPYPYAISVRVTWHEGRRARSISLSTVRLGPPP